MANIAIGFCRFYASRMRQHKISVLTVCRRVDIVSHVLRIVRGGNVVSSEGLEMSQYGEGCGNLFRPYVTQVESTEAVEPVAEWVKDSNEHERKCGEYRRLRFVLTRLTRIARQQREAAELAELLALVKRLPAELHTTPVVANHAHEVKTHVTWESLGVDLCALLDGIEDKTRRMDVAAQCVLVRAEFPEATALATFNRARAICRDVAKGRYADGNRTIDTDTENSRRIDSDALPACDAYVSAYHWQEIIREACEPDFRERYQLAADGLDPIIVEALRNGMSQREVAEMIGRTPSYVCKRLNAIRESVHI